MKALKTSPKAARPDPLDEPVVEDRPLCIWHKGCVDGFTSAWIVHAFFSTKVDFFEGVYQEPPPDVKGRNVLMVDFSYKHDVIEQMRKDAKAILILDHHKTAEADLAEYQVSDVEEFPYFPKQGECVAFFDMKRSGAGLCWDFFFPGQPRPKFVDHVQDRDLWQFKMQGTKEINLLAYSFPFDFETFDRLIETCEDLEGWRSMVIQGSGLERQHLKNCHALIEHGTHTMKIGGVTMPVVNAPWFFASEVGNLLASTHDVKCGATYFNDGDGKRSFSLRSIDGGPDVSEIAKAHGGGGHEHAAGFKVPHDWEGDADDSQ